MPKFLIDVNLPYRFGLWNDKNYMHQMDIDPKMKDTEIWQYARSNKLTIITKDSDFSNRIMLLEPPPRVIHIRFGNMGMTQFHSIMNELWEEVLVMNSHCKLVNVYSDHIEGMK